MKKSRGSFWFFSFCLFFIFHWSKAESTPVEPLPSENSSYQTSLLKLGSQYKSQMMCLCLFVMKQSEKSCARWTATDPDPFRVFVDEVEKSVQVNILFLFYESQSHFVNEQLGCVLE